VPLKQCFFPDESYLKACRDYGGGTGS
jgi:hypothetical protein